MFFKTWACTIKLFFSQNKLKKLFVSHYHLSLIFMGNVRDATQNNNIRLNGRVLLCWMSFYSESHFILSLILFWVSFYSESHFILSLILFWVSFYSDCHFILSVILFWVSFYSECHFILSVILFWVSFYSECH